MNPQTVLNPLLTPARHDRNWSVKEDTILKWMHRGGAPFEVMAEVLGRTEAAVQVRSSHLKLVKRDPRGARRKDKPEAPKETEEEINMRIYGHPSPPMSPEQYREYVAKQEPKPSLPEILRRFADEIEQAL